MKVPMDVAVFDEIFRSMSQGRSRFEVTASDLDLVFPVGWLEQAFRSTTKCIVARDQLITIRFANQRKLHHDHSACPRCQWLGKGPKPALCQAKKTWPIDVSYLFVTFSRERIHQEQKKEGKHRKFVPISCLL